MVWGPYKSVANQDENNVEFWSIRPCRDSARSWRTPCSDLSTFYILRNTPKIPTRGDVALLSRSVSTSAPDRLCMPCIGYVMFFTQGNAVDLHSVGTDSLTTMADWKTHPVKNKSPSLYDFLSCGRYLLDVPSITSLESNFFTALTIQKVPVLSSQAQNAMHFISFCF